MSGHELAYGLIVAGYLVIILAIALYVGKKWIGDESDFMVAGREMGAVITSASLVAIILSGGFVPTVVLMGFLFGIGGAWFLWGWVVGMALVMATWAGFWRYTGGYTPAEYFEYQYGVSGRLSVLVATMVFGIIAGAFQYVGAGALVAGAFGTDTTVTIIVIGGTITIYALLAGMWGISITDFIQAIWVVTAVFIAVPVYLFVNHGLPTVGENITPEMLSFPFGSMEVFGLAGGTVITFVWLNILLANSAHYWMRASAARNERTVRRGWMLSIVIVGFCGLMGAVLGLWARMLVAPDDPAQAFGLLLAQETPVWLGALAVSGVIAATMSTADMMYQMVANTVTRDFFQRFTGINSRRELLRYSRITILGMGVLTIFLATSYPGSLPQMIAFALSMGGPLFVLSMDSWLTRFGTKEGTVIMIAAVIVAIFYWEFFSPINAQIQTLWISGAVSLVTFYSVSALVRITGSWWGKSTESLSTTTTPKGGD
ncbi:sodium:solute symporter [Halomarina halobia]|uniref:Sodium:solute symporter n=1 Tax=Halomarina halobia TaxID=3033386 RepID=A0ABD6AF57_9EURY|nr:sodium:solute symporter family protein [Halomarina sp. PSR21]